MFLYGGSAKHSGAGALALKARPAGIPKTLIWMKKRTIKRVGSALQEGACEPEEQMEPGDPSCQDRGFKGGVLAHLERLEIQMNRSYQKSQQLPRTQTRESTLGAKIRELRLLRDNLRAEVKRRQVRVKASSTLMEINEQEDLERQRQNMKAILQAYHFTGLSGTLTSRGVCVCIGTAFEGNILGSYFVDLVVEKPLWIHHHSVPAFIPLEQIAAAHLQTDVQRFLFSLREHLNAYAGRKYQADQLQSDFTAFLDGPLQRNSLCNLLSFTYKVNQRGQSFSFGARLLYGDLTATLPTDVTLTDQGMEASPAKEEHRAAHESLFRTKPLHRVFASFSKEVEKLDFSLVS